MLQEFKFNDFKIQINVNAYVIPIYQQITGNDLFADLSRMSVTPDNNVANFSLRTLLDILFAFAYNADEELNYEKFYQKLPLNLTTNKDFIEKLVKLITENLVPDTEKNGTGVNTQKK